MEEKNKIKVYTSSQGAELNISAPSTKQLVSATNNKAQYFAEQAMKYRDEAKIHRDNAKYYAEQNSNVTFEYINNIKSSLEDKINEKQNQGDYALREDLPVNVSELINDSAYVNKTELDELRLPEQEGNSGCFLMTDGNEKKWVGIYTIQMFDTILKDYLLNYEETKGLALQGTYVYKEAIAGSRYGYPNFYNKCLEERNTATATQVTLSGSTITMYVASNGHQYYDIANKDVVDTFFETMGSAWFYGVDTENERIFLPRNNFFEQAIGDTTEVGKSIEAGLPNITGSASYRSDLTSGAFGKYQGTAYGLSASSSSPNCINFDASLSNPIYGNSDTVQPNAVKKLLYICVGNTTNYEGLTDVVNQGMEILEQVNQGIESRVNLDATNLNTQGKSLIASYGMPSNKYINLTLGAGGTTYTAPANGWFALAKECSNGQFIYMGVSNGISTQVWGAGAGYVQSYLPVLKGNVVNVNYTASGATAFFRFHYAEGDK